MAPNVVTRIRDKLAKRRHSFTGSLRSARSTASSIRSGTGRENSQLEEPDPKQQQHHHHQQSQPQLQQPPSRSNTPSQLASQVLLPENDNDLDGSSSSTSAPSTDTTATTASQDHVEEKPRQGHDGTDEREDDEDDDDDETEPHLGRQQRQLRQTQKIFEKWASGQQYGHGGPTAQVDDASVKATKAAAGEAAEGAAIDTGATAATGGTARAPTAASTEAAAGASAGEPAEEPAEAPRPTGKFTGQPTGQPTEDSGTGSGADGPQGSDPPNRHPPACPPPDPQQQAFSQPSSDPSSSRTSSPPPSSFSPSSSAASAPPPPTTTTTTTPCTTSTPTASSQKPVPPPLSRQNSWPYRRSAAQQLHSIDEDSDPPSPTTITPPTSTDQPQSKSFLAAPDDPVTATTSGSDDSYSSSGGRGRGGVDDDANDQDNDNETSDSDDDGRDADTEQQKSAHARELRSPARRTAPRGRRARQAVDKQLNVTVSEAPASRPPPGQNPKQSQSQSQALARVPLPIAIQTPSGSIAGPADGTRANKLLQAAAAAAASPRKQSLFDNRHSHLIKTLLETNGVPDEGEYDPSCVVPILEEIVAMATRKIWVKRLGASPTLVTIKEDDLVDDVRDTILAKYGNSLGKTFDSPDLNLRILPRDGTSLKERVLGPEEPMCRTLDSYFPGSQTVNEALLIVVDAPAPRRHPRPSPRTQGLYPMDSAQPPENGEGYFPPLANGGGMPSPHRGIVLQPPPPASAVHPGSGSGPGPTHSIAVLSTGHVPNIPSPGGSRPRFNREQNNRPKLNRTHTQSPNVVGPSHAAATKSSAVAADAASTHSRPSHSRAQSNSSEHARVGNGPPLPGSPVAAVAVSSATATQQARVATPPPPPRVTSPRTSTAAAAAAAARMRKAKKLPSEPLQPSTLNGSVPPISVLIVEDNPINLKLLEAFVKKLKVRWSTAMNGRDAVTKWRTGGFHLVLMDIQLPVMNGLDATREIRRLERVNSIGVFTSTAGARHGTSSEDGYGDGDGDDESALRDQDKLEDMKLFKSPVIIVALTASSLQSDRHEALAAGCNDFLTKPVNFVWLERKIMEWGCMQALIDFDGWRKWKNLSEAQAKEANAKAISRTRVKKNKSSASNSSAILAES